MLLRSSPGSGIPRSLPGPRFCLYRRRHRRRLSGARSRTLATTSPLLIRDEADRAAYARVERQVRLARYGGDCYAYCALAAGLVDLVIETNLKPHDVVALVPIIEGAGGVITTWDGENAAQGGRIGALQADFLGRDLEGFHGAVA